ncbi:MAG: hypothetical protein ACRDZP_02240, partial [Acidimicrobiales bacterium]
AQNMVLREKLFVPTDAAGTQRHDGVSTPWPLPLPSGEDSGGSGGKAFAPGEVIRAGEGESLALFDLEELVGELGQRIFVAEVVAELARDRPVEAVGMSVPAVARATAPVAAARLVSETAWSVKTAARFALDCVDHVLLDAASVRLPSGVSFADIVTAARSHLDEGGSDGGPGEALGLVQRFSRLALARRLRRESDEVADLAFTLTVEDEAADLDAFDDPAFGAAAALRDAVLAAVEAIRHDAMPRMFEAESARYESEALPGAGGGIVGSPWGSFVSGSRRGAVPAWVAARDAADRAREVVSDDEGSEAARAERAWQGDTLASHLGL